MDHHDNTDTHDPLYDAEVYDYYKSCIYRLKARLRKEKPKEIVRSPEKRQRAREATSQHFGIPHRMIKDIVSRETARRGQ